MRGNTAKDQLNVYAFTDEVPGILERFVELKGLDEDFFNVTIVATDGGAYQNALDEALVAGEVDLFCAEAAFIKKYAENPLVADVEKDLGITKAEMDAAGLAPYTVDIGINTAGELKGLSFQACGGAFIYRADLAEAILGTDDPDDIGEMTDSWEKFFDVARELAEYDGEDFPNGAAIISGAGDLFHPIDAGKAQPWVVNGNLVIDKLFYDPAEDALDYFEMARILKQENLSNQTTDWQDAWFADFSGSNERPCFGFYGPAWLINYVLAPNCGDTFGDWRLAVPTVGFYWGGTWLMGVKDSKHLDTVADIIRWFGTDISDDGVQAYWATRDVVASTVIMDKTDAYWPILGGEQNAFDIFVPACKAVDGTTLSAYDEKLNSLLNQQVQSYANDEKTKDEAIEQFKLDAKEAFADISV
ncbi:MAG: extracellular solute-binding protein [Oscillospiraceae bacterium]|nr:extracellular solute-binding protein [Oscillospiraceae bacterium]